MSKLTNRQRKELRVLMYFVPSQCPEVDDTEIQRFFAWSSRGEDAEQYKKDAWNNKASLYWAKNRRDLQIASYKEDWGETVNAWTFNDEPRWFADWVSKKLNKPAIIKAWEEANV